MRVWLNTDNNLVEFLDSICNMLNTEQSLPVKSMLAECICDFIKLTNWQMFEPLVLHSGYMQKAIAIVDHVVTSEMAINPTLVHFKSEINKLVYNLVWSLGMLNAERPEFSNVYLESGGVMVCLRLMEQYHCHCEMMGSQFEEELESVVTYALTSSCYEGDFKDYKVIEPIIPFLQDQLIRQDFTIEMVCNESLMGLESILGTGGTLAIRHFMEYENVDKILMKLLSFLSESIQKILLQMNKGKNKKVYVCYPENSA